MEFRILGPLEVVSDGRALSLGGAKQRALLALLLLHAEEPVSVGRIVDELWGDGAGPNAPKNVQVYVSHLRKVLGEGAIETRPPGYALRLAGGEIDAEQAERALAAAAATDSAEERAETLRAALGLWRGPPLADLDYEEFAQAEIARLDELRLHLLEERIDADLELGRHADVIGELEKLVSANPLRERLRGQLMLALYRSGRQAEALATYRAFRSHLAEELGLEPSSELRELERRILAQDAALEARPGSAAASETRPDTVRGLRQRRPLVLVAAAGALLAVAALLAALLVTSRGTDAPAAIHVPIDAVAVVDPESEAVIAAIPVGRRPETITAGAGAVWVANIEDRTVSRIDPETFRVTKTVGLGFEPTDLAADDDHVWVAGGYDHVLWRIDRDGVARLKLRFTEALGALPPGFEDGPAGVAADGASVWLSHGNEVTELDPGTGAVRRTIAAGGTWHRVVEAGVGRLWVGFNDSTRSEDALPNPGLDVVDPSDGSVLRRTELVSDARDILFDSGRLWVALAVGDAVWELDPRSGVVQRTLQVGDEPEGLAFLDDALWVTNESDATVRRVDPFTGESTATISIGNNLERVTAFDGLLWVTVRGPAVRASYVPKRAACSRCSRAISASSAPTS